MTTNITAARMRAEASFGKSGDRASPAAQAAAEQQAEARVIQEKTARLKALRLAKEAADRAAEPPTSARKPQVRPKTRRARASTSG